jgi:hypothetical protein
VFYFVRSEICLIWIAKSARSVVSSATKRSRSSVWLLRIHKKRIGFVRRAFLTNGENIRESRIWWVEDKLFQMIHLLCL